MLSHRDIAFGAVLAALLWAVPATADPAKGGQTTKSAPFDVQNRFYPTGYMGDGEAHGAKAIELDLASTVSPHSAPHCVRIRYVPKNQAWAGVYWHNHAGTKASPGNWGERPGADFSGKGYRALSFWARGEKGGEVVEFKTGGIDAEGKKHRDSFGASLGRKTLTRKWKRYTIDLTGQDLSSVIGGFAWVAAANANTGGLTFYLDDIQFE